MTVEFRLLGEVEARVDGRRLDIGHARQRCVLAALLVDVNQPIPMEQLVDRVWSDRPPYSARNSLATYVSRLRNLFAEAAGVAISRGPGGYVLETDALSVDVHRFRHWAAQARATADPVEATVLFDRAWTSGVVSRLHRWTPPGSTTCAARWSPSGFRWCWIATTSHCVPGGTPNCWGS